LLGNNGGDYADPIVAYWDSHSDNYLAHAFAPLNERKEVSLLAFRAAPTLPTLPGRGWNFWISEAEPGATDWIVYLEGTLGPPALTLRAPRPKAPQGAFVYRDRFAWIATELGRQGECEVGAGGVINVQKCNRSAA
jgi:hypothetical protein